MAFTCKITRFQCYLRSCSFSLISPFRIYEVLIFHYSNLRIKNTPLKFILNTFTFSWETAFLECLTALIKHFSEMFLSFSLRYLLLVLILVLIQSHLLPRYLVDWPACRSGLGISQYLDITISWSYYSRFFRESSI